MPALLPPPTTQGKGQPDGAGARKAAEWRGLWVIFGGGLNGAPCEVDIKSDSSSAEVGLRHSHCFCLVMFKCQWERRKKERKIYFFLSLEVEKEVGEFGEKEGRPSLFPASI